ncbi:hypothetical protein A5893_07885 [Pedobacter psychrophilus]|uniref:DUF4905 domain-containing protein n=1 Tax=Pedobacter psychrophilus TaxID=1826909 RepID=A0A179DJ96_9SPHI|nr:DUF4905 domain-containing protein [Pedobacter psychrophilus]OAQ40842.1 hypothetical protein A5893_07885 [Pedobacter psychrophilus]
MISSKYTAKHLHSPKSNQIIWKIILDDDNETIVWESRTNDKKVFFNSYDFIGHKYLLQDFYLEDDWLLNIQTVKNQILYLSGFESEFSPVQKGIIALDLKSKKVLWQNFSVTLQQFTQQGLVVFDPRVNPRKYKLLNSDNGELVETVVLEDLIFLKSLNNEIILPKIIDENLDLETKHQLFYKDLEILSGYKPQGNHFDQYLIVKKNDAVLFEDIINQAITKKSFDTFFIWQSKLIFIKNKSEIVSYLV